MSEQLASWHDTETRKAIVDFVERVTTEGGADYVPPSERIAVYDNDGTLWCEKPMPIELGFVLMRAGGDGRGRRVPAREAAVEGRARAGLRVARRRDHEALPRRRQRREGADGRHDPGVRGTERRALLGRGRGLPARRQAPDARPRVSRVRLPADDRAAPAISRRTGSPTTSPPAAIAISCARSPRRSTGSRPSA